MGLAEDRELDRQLTECLRNGPSGQLVNNTAPVQPTAGIGIGISPDPNDTVETIPHPTPVRDRLRAAANHPDLSKQDRVRPRMPTSLVSRIKLKPDPGDTKRWRKQRWRERRKDKTVQ